MNRKTTEIENTRKQMNGGYIVYWKLIPQVYSQVLGMISLARGKAKFATIMLFIGCMVRTPYWLLIKPFGAILFHTEKHYNVTIRDDTLILWFRRTKVIYLFRFFPVYCLIRYLPRGDDLKYLFKDKADEIVISDSAGFKKKSSQQGLHRVWQ